MGLGVSKGGVGDEINVLRLWPLLCCDFFPVFLFFLFSSSCQTLELMSRFQSKLHVARGQGVSSTSDEGPGGDKLKGEEVEGQEEDPKTW